MKGSAALYGTRHAKRPGMVLNYICANDSET